jgi:glyoxylase-like metal-dependent hydrolase (beta-lactamase superfamily II)
MAPPGRKRELARGERTLPGVWRLRLPLPFEGVPHGNAWAVRAGDGIVLVDTGVHEPGSMAQLELALAMAGWQLEDVRLLVCTHAHSDHYGQAATILDRVGCELWMHPNHRHTTVEKYDADRFAGFPLPDRHLVDGVEVESDLGTWQAVETPGHAPSHVCLWQPERRLLISGDHLLGRVALSLDFGHTPDPAGEFLRSLDRVEALNPRLCLSGHGRTFTDVQGHIDAYRALMDDGLAKTESIVRSDGPLRSVAIVARVFGADLAPLAVEWREKEVRSYLRHLEVGGRVVADGSGRWAPA